MKRCCKCKQFKSRADFYVSKSAVDGLNSYCKSCCCEWQRNAYIKNASKVSRWSARRYQERASLVRALKALPCADCGGTFDPVCMDFDHRPGETKSFCLSSRLGSRSIDSIAKEAAKCDVVCANCHRLRTFKQRDHSAFQKRKRPRREMEIQ